MCSKDLKIYIAGHNGMVGKAIWKTLLNHGFNNLIGVSSKEVDLRNQYVVNDFFLKERPDVVIDSAAKVGGILANNNFPYIFLMENMQIQNNLFESALKYGVEKFIFLGSSCIYPKLATQPIKEDSLLTGQLEQTNEWYALAKISGVKACQAISTQFNKNYFSLMPSNLYGHFDNFDLNSSHVLPAMIRKFYNAKNNGNEPVKLWGSGNPFREFLYVDDLADAVVFSLQNSIKPDIYNVGTGSEISIRDLASKIQKIIGHQGDIEWDSSKPDGTPRKLLDVSKLNSLGWKYKTNLDQGIINTYSWFLENKDNLREVKY